MQNKVHCTFVCLSNDYKNNKLLITYIRDGYLLTMPVFELPDSDVFITDMPEECIYAIEFE